MPAASADQPSIEDVRAEWRNKPRTELKWRTSSDQSGNDVGECKGEWVVADEFPYAAYLKPGQIGRPEWGTPLACYEKIASDLAFDLRCPVPAVQLWNREAPPKGYAKDACVSLKELPRHYSWSLARTLVSAKPQSEEEEVQSALVKRVFAECSGMLVLDTWLGQEDRGNHPNNVKLGHDPQAPASTKLVYLDFARTMNWNNAWSNEGWKDVKLCVQPSLVMESLDKNVVEAALAKAEAMSKGDLEAICLRLVGPGFTDKQAKQVVEALIGRQSLIRQVIAP